MLSTAQRHTHFLDSRRATVCMTRSDFSLADLRRRVTSVFLVLPPNRLDAFSRWLPLLVSQALGEIAREAEALSRASRGRTGALRGFWMRPEGTAGPGGAPVGSEGPQGPSRLLLQAPRLHLRR